MGSGFEVSSKKTEKEEIAGRWSGGMMCWVNFSVEASY